jgi:hypothetical protein
VCAVAIDPVAVRDGCGALMLRVFEFVAAEGESKRAKTRQSEKTSTYEGESGTKQCLDMSRHTNMTSAFLRTATDFGGEECLGKSR